eukprot:TRINITY_DN10370_c0_g4_i4.p1 TRINITY_DN10370_c0_g4~~TRINITY_DN10370_c0_g4_i4.p1  ORF type:complete len:332 (-),score=53.74 TRINITY_DN10370_c0_g4_i4:121-1116(-)
MGHSIGEYMKGLGWHVALMTRLNAEVEFRPRVKEVTAEVAGVTDWQSKLKEGGVGYLCQSGIIKAPNQDDMSIIANPNFLMIGVSDGHGPYGHYCSYIVQQMLPRFVLSSLQYPHNIPQALNDSFVFAHEALMEIAAQQEVFDVSISGTTFVIAFVDKVSKKLHIAHAGDTRAIIVKNVGQKNEFRIAAKALTNDHNMRDAKEYARIMVAEGDIRQADRKGPLRFYCKGTDYPGLAVSRTIGDTVSKMYGVTYKPDITQVSLSPDDLFIVIASDGVWDRLNNEEVAEIVHRQGRANAQEAAKEIAGKAQKLWKAENSLYCDDITCVVCWVQ